MGGGLGDGGVSHVPNQVVIGYTLCSLYVMCRQYPKISGPAFLFSELKRRNTRMKLYQFQFVEDAVNESQHTHQRITVHSYMRKLV
jgi:hypothetical protein